MENLPICSLRSIESSEFLNPITHRVVLNDSTCELKISNGFGFQDVGRDGGGSGGGGGGFNNFVGILKIRVQADQCLGFLFFPSFAD